MLKWHVKKDKMLDFINEYEPLWYELCELYELGAKHPTNNISRKELNTLDLEITLEQLHPGCYEIVCINHNDNDCIVYQNICEEDGSDSLSDWLEYLELID